MNLPQNITDQVLTNDSFQNCNHHTDNFGNFYIEENPFMKLENQQKIVINGKVIGFSKKKCIVVIIFFILIIVSIFLGIGNPEFIPLIVIFAICYGISLIWSFTAKSGPVTTVYYNKEKKIIEIVYYNKIISVGLYFVDKVKMYYNEGYFYYIFTKSGENSEILKLPSNWVAPFKEGETILNDFIDYWKNKEGFNLPQC